MSISVSDTKTGKDPHVGRCHATLLRPRAVATYLAILPGFRASCRIDNGAALLPMHRRGCRGAMLMDLIFLKERINDSHTVTFRR
ncbi:hypothetical protein WM40_09465 [Robbsia andropogonis]|uniref:Uncharacterized protein n=1 Tax=Robbsia andropogonis TaxID=28092 RepID=A0A0F5K1R3_9BURK|nr:hypothetical protein [Robbsia andropogonis]KKB63870.1 hypothetical protein WM40_09465 [Robbsia andropogonis]MCP1116665.1 hypothetical protein [Robbsia andropogonis]MCP1126656.1 hypothetical protein [Robbsia andropogonis]